MLRPKQAAELGIADVLFEPADFLERSLEWAAGVVGGDVTVERPEVDRDMWDGVLFFAKRSSTSGCTARCRPPTGRSSCSRWPRTRRSPTGTAAENEALADLIMSDELRASLYAFDLVQRRAKRPVGRRTRRWPARSPRSASSAPA